MQRLTTRDNIITDRLLENVCEQDVVAHFERLLQN
jgi:hypothetical protein